MAWGSPSCRDVSRYSRIWCYVINCFCSTWLIQSLLTGPGLGDTPCLLHYIKSLLCMAVAILTDVQCHQKCLLAVLNWSSHSWLNWGVQGHVVLVALYQITVACGGRHLVRVFPGAPGWVVSSIWLHLNSLVTVDWTAGLGDTQCLIKSLLDLPTLQDFELQMSLSRLVRLFVTRCCVAKKEQGTSYKTGIMAAPAPTTDSAREKALIDYRKKLLEHKELEARLKESKATYVFVEKR